MSGLHSRIVRKGMVMEVSIRKTSLLGRTMDGFGNKSLPPIQKQSKLSGI